MSQIEPLVMLPPMLCDGRVFAPQMMAFSRERVVVVAPVHGAERVEEIASALLDCLPQRFALLGMGFGGRVALELLRRAPARVLRLALIGTSPLAETPEQAALREPIMIAAKMGRMDEVAAQEVPSSALFDSEGRAAIVSAQREMALAFGAGAYLHQARASQRCKDQTPILRSAEVPVLMMAGEVDPVLTPKRQAFLSELLETAEFHTIEDAGVMPTLEQPSEVMTALRDWMSAPMMLR